MSWIAVAVAGAGLVGGMMQADAAGDAAQMQADSAAAGTAETRRQFDALQALLKPYADAGPGALAAQQNLLGLNGVGAQQAAIGSIQNGAEFQALQQSGQNAILQNASATGGLRGGNVQSALAQFSPRLLSSLIEQQYSRLGGITSIGQNAAAGTGNAGMQAGANIANLLQQQGAAQAGGALGQAAAYGGIANSLAGGFGLYSGLNRGGATTAPATTYTPSTMPAADYSLGTASFGGF
jgi:hypothetical protein